MSEIFKVAISGAPCAGKTTIIDKLKSHYTSKGINVVSVPESARQLIAGGVSRDDIYSFEYEVAKKQLQNESEIEKSFDSPVNDTLILFDRGLTDAFSYLTDKDRIRLQNTIDISPMQSWSRYDAVLFLETTAINNKYVNDDERSENINEAISCHMSLLDVWMGHPHLRYIESTDNIEEKLKKVISEIDCIVNSTEHEMKYLIEYPDLSFLKNYKHFKAEIEQIYLTSDSGSHRIRKRGAGGEYQYFESLKIRLTGNKCYEYENIITEEMYNDLKANADPDLNPIVKDRYCFLYKGQYFEMDIFPFWSDKALIELEISSDDQEVILPPEITFIKDVSTKKKYKNRYLAGLKL